MADEPTAWEEINPPATVSAPRRELVSPSLGTETRIVFRNELVACLTLVAPAGMTEEQRRDWLAVAWSALKHLPPDVLASGARKARLKCDHPAKIVPTIIAETAEQMVRERSAREWSVPQLPAPEPEYISAAEAAKILREFGLKGGEPQ